LNLRNEGGWGSCYTEDKFVFPSKQNNMSLKNTDCWKLFNWKNCSQCYCWQNNLLWI